MIEQVEYQTLVSGASLDSEGGMSWSVEQLALFGVASPTADCWIDAVAGTWVKQGTMRQFLRLRGDAELKEKAVQEKQEKQNWVYLIGNREYGWCKIGTTINLLKRFGSIQSSCPFQIEIFALFRNKGEAFEKRLHRRVEPYHLRGEWFLIEGKLKDFIDKVEHIQTLGEFRTAIIEGGFFPYAS